jgi:transcriptional regulator with XRE-family HTH domain
MESHSSLILHADKGRSTASHPMAPHRLNNYLKSHRKWAGLSQPEVAFLLGKNETEVNRFENNRRIPPLDVAFGFQEIYKAPLAELFAGLQQSVAVEIASRIGELSGRIPTGNAHDELALRKLLWLSRGTESKDTLCRPTPCRC